MGKAQSQKYNISSALVIVSEKRKVKQASQECALGIVEALEHFGTLKTVEVDPIRESVVSGMSLIKQRTQGEASFVANDFTIDNGEKV